MQNNNSQPEKLIIIVPCRNEGSRIGKVVGSIYSLYPAARVAVIDDESSDNSAAEATRAGAIVLSHPSNLGYGAALETGYNYALAGDFDLLVQMDGDGQHVAGEIPALLSPVQDGTADLVLGSRYLKDPASKASSPLRRLGHTVFSFIIFLLTGLRLSDPTSGFQAMNRKALRLFSSGMFPCDYPDSDVIIMAHLSGLRIKEVPVVMLVRKGGASMHSGLKPLYYGIKMLLAIFIVLLNCRTWTAWRRNYIEPGNKQQ